MDRQKETRPGMDRQGGIQPSMIQQRENRPSMDWENEDWREEGWTEEEWLEEKRREEERQQRHRQRIEQMKREKHRREMMFRYSVPAAAVAAVLCIALLVAGIIRAVRPKEDQAGGKENPVGTLAGQGEIPGGNEGERSPLQGGQSPLQGEQPPSQGEQSLLQELQTAIATTLQQGNPIFVGTAWTDPACAIGAALLEAPRQVFEAHATESTDGFGDGMSSEYGIIIDVESGEVLAQKGGWGRINPASMTKVLTVLVAAEQIADLGDTFTMTIEITDYCFVNDCSNTGFEVGEEIPLKDLFYGTVLPSGADAALGLAFYVAGSQEAFVDLMNAKLEELGLSETTHFTNCIGLYDQDHYSTPYDMAVILKEAADNEFCRQVLSEHHYVTSATAEHPEGIDISNWFLRRIEDRDTHGEVLCAKTGYVDQSGSCAASLAADHGGREYICVTTGANRPWACIMDHVTLYQKYLPQ